MKQPPAGQAAPMKQPPAQTPPMKTPPATDPMDALPPEAATLPAENSPPRAVPPVMDYTKELMTDAENKALETEVVRVDKFSIVFRNAELNAKTKAVVDKWAKWRMYQLSLTSMRNRLHEIRGDITRELTYAGNSRNVNRKQTEEFRNYLCDQVTKRGAELLKNNFHARLNAALILAQLNLTEQDDNRQIPEQAYVKAAVPLLDVLNAPTGGGIDEQLEAIKIQAAIGLGRINLLGPPGDLNINVQNQNLRIFIAKTLITQLQNPSAHPWYQMRLCESLASIDLINDVTTGRPIIVQQLGEVLADREREFRVRARAARSLGRCILPAGVNTQKLVFQILLLEHEMAQEYQKNPNEYYWMDCFLDVYYAFHPITETENQLYGGKRPPGLNQKNLGALVRDAFTAVLPIASHVVNQKGFMPPKEGEAWVKNEKIPAQLISDLAKWLQDHQPSSHKLSPNLPDLDPQSPLPTASTGATTSG